MRKEELEPMEMVLIPAGEFMMGAAPDDKAAYEDEYHIIKSK